MWSEFRGPRPGVRTASRICLSGRRLKFKASSGPSNVGRPNDVVVYFTEERESRVTATSLGFVKGDTVFAPT